MDIKMRKSGWYLDFFAVIMEIIDSISVDNVINLILFS